MRMGYFLIVIIILVYTSGCSRHVSIKDIVDNPREYVDKEVIVDGKVTQKFSLLIVSYFEVDDGSGKIYVITDKPLPNVGSSMTVKGTLIYYSLGTQAFYAIQEANNKSE